MSIVKFPANNLFGYQENEVSQFVAEIIQQEASKIVEPKRSGLSVDQLGLKLRGGVQNIIKVYNQATPEEKNYWGKWYQNAKSDVEDLARQFNLPFPVVAGVVAVLSPGNKWSMNLFAAERLLQGQTKINAYPRQVQRALRILETGDTGLVSGPKVTVFFNSLMNPKLVEKDMVLDGHAINIWRGEKVTLKNLTTPDSKERAQMIQDYQTAANELGVSVQAVQAVTWYIWKYTGKTAPLEAPTGIYDVSKFRNAQPANDISLDEVGKKKLKTWFHVTEKKHVLPILQKGFTPSNGSAGLGTYLWATKDMAYDWIDGNTKNYREPVILKIGTQKAPEHVADMAHIDPEDSDQYQGHYIVRHTGIWKPETIEVEEDFNLDEVNALGAGGIVGAGMGNGGTDSSKKLMWSGDQPLKETFYHGTSTVVGLSPGSELLPPKDTSRISEKGRKKNLDRVFFTKDVGSARIYAGRAVQQFGGNPTIFVVEPEGKVELINPTPGSTVFMSPKAKVVKQIAESTHKDLVEQVLESILLKLKQ